VDDYQNVCYLIHFDEPIGNAQHYLGFAPDLQGRMKKHRTNKGAKITAIANNRGIGYRVVRVWKVPEPFYKSEKYLKGLGAADLCPHCSRYIRAFIPLSVPDEKAQGRPFSAQ
jgi:putative endonuclease